ncbi:MAG: ABC transporter ATP-binding protein [Deltaproteobacteria bacterium]|nr:ABC transporter ATP-binding protein [Deltaproteobacteria bacterium]
MSIETKDLRKEYGTLVAVRDVNIALEPGNVVGLIGPNGAGKTTLLRLLGTLLPPTSGTASMFGWDLKKDYLMIREKIGFLPDFFNLYSDLTLKECLIFFATAYGMESSAAGPRAIEALKYVELENRRDDLIKNLSRGMVQRLGVATLIVHDPDLFLLDEPASGLDPKARIQLRHVLTKLSEEGRTVVISSHILTELSGFCSHIAVMNLGEMMLYGEVKEIERRMMGGKRARVTVLEDVEHARGLIDPSPDLSVAEVQERTLLVEGVSSNEDLAQLNRLLVSGGVGVVELSLEKTSLEDLFMKISSGEVLE